MEILYFDEIGSTQVFLSKKIKAGEMKAPIAIFSDNQTNGVGSSGRSWQGKKGNFFLSFALGLADLPLDLPRQSVSIYFAFILKEVFAAQGSKAFIKWPNDFYIGKKKIGGAISALTSDAVICGIGINRVFVGDDYGVLDVEMSNEQILELFFLEIQRGASWAEIFRKYKVEFPLSYEFNTHHNGVLIPLKKSILQQDGSLMINGERVLNLR